MFIERYKLFTIENKTHTNNSPKKFDYRMEISINTPHCCHAVLNGYTYFDNNLEIGDVLSKDLWKICS